jgi:molybdopterin-binding protein
VEGCWHQQFMPSGAISPGLTGANLAHTIAVQMAKERTPSDGPRGNEELLRLRDAAVQLQVSYNTVKQWIYHRKLRAIQTPGGHYRVPQSEIDRLLYRTRGRTQAERRVGYQRISGRNQLVGRIVDVRVSGLVSQVTLSVGGQLITSLITSGAVREMGLKKGQTAAALIKATEVMIIRV